MKPRISVLTVLTLVGVSLTALHAQSPQVQLEGRGDDVSRTVTLQNGLLMVAAGHRGSRNFVLMLQNVSGPDRELFVNTIGNYTGGRIAPVKAGDYVFQVTADGSWLVRYTQPAPAKGHQLPAEQDGRGDSVLGPLDLQAGLLRVTLTHRGARNFAAVLYRATGERVGMLVNEIGAYSGTVAHTIRAAGLHYIDIQADGEWSFKAQ